MSTVLKWTLGIAGAAVGGTCAFVAVQAGRRRVKDALTRAEEITDETRATLERTESTLRTVRDAI